MVLQGEFSRLRYNGWCAIAVVTKYIGLNFVFHPWQIKIPTYLWSIPHPMICGVGILTTHSNVMKISILNHTKHIWKWFAGMQFSTKGITDKYHNALHYLLVASASQNTTLITGCQKESRPITNSPALCVHMPRVS